MLPIDRTAKSALDGNLVNGNTSDAPVIKNSNDVVYNTIDELNNKVNGLISSGALSPYPPAQYNQLINSNFDVWQRGTSFVVNNLYSADRWATSISATTAAGTISRQPFTIGQSAVPNNPKYFMRINPTLTGCTYFVEEQRIEGFDKFAGQTVTFSFWAKADTAQTISAFLRQNFGTGGTPSADVSVTGSNIALTTAWTKYTVTFTLPSISGKTLGSNANDYVSFGLNLPLTGTYNIDIAQVQLNTGSIVLPFQPRSYQEEERSCQRFCHVVNPANNVNMYLFGGIADSATTFKGVYRFPITMRTVPALTVINPASFRLAGPTFSAASAVADAGLTFDSPNSMFLNVTSSGLTVNSFYHLQINSDGVARLIFDAEL